MTRLRYAAPFVVIALVLALRVVMEALIPGGDR